MKKILTAEILEKMILEEMHAFGLNASSVHFKPQRKSYEPEAPPSPSEPPEKLSLEVYTPDGSTKVIEFDDEPTQDYKTRLAVNAFQRLYRSFDVDTRYFFLRWLRPLLVKELTAVEAAEICAQLNASGKAYSAPKNPNK